jgi:tetratricopeptide (TPR) repeat protein
VAILKTCRNIAIELLWAIRPHGSRARDQELTALIRRFPYWENGRKRLAEEALKHENIACAYAEALALRTLASPGSKLYAESSLLLGRCFLKKTDALTAREYLREADSLLPNDPRIQEELAATYTLTGEKESALQILQQIAPDQLSREAKAVLQWLSTPSGQQ